MNKIEKGKTGLLTLGIIIAVLSGLAIVGGIALIALLENKVIGIIAGIILLGLALVGIIIAVYFIWVSLALVATKGSVAEDNLGKGTINQIKCPKCATEIKGNEDFCPKCGKDLRKLKKCTCGAENEIDNKVCVKCGKKFDD